MTTAAATPAATIPKWPLFLAPIIAFIYYAAIQDGFAVAIRDVIPNARDLDEAVGGFMYPKWGTHWIYRAVSEAISLALATIVAGGMARERARTAALIGGLTISVFYVIRLTILIWAEQHVPDTIVVPEPWSQYLIEGCLIVAAPLIGLHFSEGAKEVSTQKPYGFGGIPRAHFIWLWLPLYWYSAAMVGPIMRMWLSGFWDGGFLSSIIALVNLIPIAIFAAPLFLGLGLLSGDNAPEWRPASRHIVGSLVLIFGFAIAAFIQAGLNWLAHRF